MSGKLGLDEIDLKEKCLVLNKKVKIGFSDGACTALLNKGLTKLIIVPMDDPNKDDVELLAIISMQDLKAKLPKWEPYKKSELFSDLVENGDLKGSGLKPYKGNRYSFAEIQVNITKLADDIIENYNARNFRNNLEFKLRKKENNFFVFSVNDEDLEPSARLTNIHVIDDLLKQQKQRGK